MSARPLGPVRGLPEERGFTLVETLVAVVILALGIVAVANLLLVSSTSSAVANQATAAAAAAGETLELLQAAPFDDPRLEPGGSLTSDAAGHFRHEDVPGVGRLVSRWSVRTAGPRTKVVRVLSQGESPLTAGRSRALFTLVRTCTAQARGCPGP